MSKLIEKMYEAMATGCGTYMEASQLSEILAHIERLEVNQIPEGCVAVPREPTEAMMIAGQEAVLQAPDDLEGAAHYIYTHMIAAATHGEGE